MNGKDSTCMEFVMIFIIAVQSVEGEALTMNKVTRSEMGAYLCIAANGVPPSVSKRMMLHVHCKFDFTFHNYKLI